MLAASVHSYATWMSYRIQIAWMMNLDNCDCTAAEAFCISAWRRN